MSTKTETAIENPLAVWRKRQRPRMKQTAFAEKIQRNSTTVSRWETGLRFPRPVDQERIALATQHEVPPAAWHAWGLYLDRQKDAAA